METLTEQRTRVRSIEDVIEAARPYTSVEDLETIRQAYVFADEAHRGQRRSTGEPYITHPVAVAYRIAQLKLGTTAVVAALLHDVREDTAPTYYEQIVPRFGEAVNFLVEGVTKLSKIQKLRENRGSVEDLRNIFLAMTRDIRVIIIKLADRLHNLQTLYGLPGEKQKRIAQQTLDIYAPIADRLGMGEMKGQLEDLAFEYAAPEKARWVRSLIKTEYQERVRQSEALRATVADELRRHQIKALDVHGRAKRLYSLYLKLGRYNNDIDQIYDLVALRVIVPTLEECYKALGIIHRRWKPLVGKIKDYCATPKANGYQSLHTTVILDEGKFVEIQIRTAEMHERAERGIAAAWAYAESKPKGSAATAANIASRHDIAWVEQLARWQTEVENPEEFFQTLRADFFRNRIFCLTPAGEIINLPEGATPIDFAYAVHTELGHRAIGAKVNRQRMPLDHALRSGDLIEIEVGPSSHAPLREWLDFVKTTNARKHIKQWYNRLDKENSRRVGHELFNAELKQLLDKDAEKIDFSKRQDFLKQYGYQDFDTLFIAIGRGTRNPRQVVKRMFAEELYAGNSQPGHAMLNVRIEGQSAIAAKRASCCRPIEGDSIVAVVSKSTAWVHREECTEYEHQPGEQHNAFWIIDPKRSYRLWIRIVIATYIGMMRDLSGVSAQAAVPIHDVHVTKNSDGTSQVSLLIEIPHHDKLSELMRKIRSLPRVQHVARGGGPKVDTPAVATR
jgi:guanosine-3',5'-bis(diphosphate) 3'-pyrophosphohydrolase